MDGDVTYEPISNLGGASNALREFLSANYPDDPLTKILSNIVVSFKVFSDNNCFLTNTLRVWSIFQGVDKFNYNYFFYYNMQESDEDNDENDGNLNKNLNFLAKWHQKTTRGSTQYWLRKGEDKGDTPSLLKRMNDEHEGNWK